MTQLNMFHKYEITDQTMYSADYDAAGNEYRNNYAYVVNMDDDHEVVSYHETVELAELAIFNLCQADKRRELWSQLSVQSELDQYTISTIVMAIYPNK